MKFLCIAEKPSVMRELQAVYNKFGCSMGQVDFAAFHGHLMKLPAASFYDPRYEKWDKNDLPIIPNFQYVEEDKKSCADLMRKIRGGNYDGLINACDAGREGEHIFYSFYEAEKLTLPVYRFWASDTTEENLHKALDNLIDAKKFDGLRQAAKLRAQADWLTGINLSRAATLQADTKVPIGRVQSPTLSLIVKRELDIRNFVPKDLFEVKAKFKTGINEEYEGSYLIPPENKETKFEDKSKAESAAKAIDKDGEIESVTATIQKTSAPSLYSLIELQKDAAKYFGYRADKTLALAQSLYETHKVLTYPRTESRFLPTAMAKEITNHLKPIESIPELTTYVQGITTPVVDKVMQSKSYVDNAKITDHHAIIPTKEKPNLAKMSEDEKKLYTLVCKRLLSIFMPAYEVEKTVIITKTNDGSVFKTNGKVIKEKGFSVLYPSDAKDIILPSVKKGDKVSVSKVGISAGRTKPPARYNTNTLLSAMENVGQQITKEELRKILRDTAGLGTSATRAEILKKLETYNFVTIQRQAFVPTDFGIAVVENFGKNGVFSAELTAQWESKLREVENETMKPSDFYNKLIEYVKKETDAVLSTDCNLRMLSFPIVGNCPICGKPMRSFKDYFVCEDYKHGDKPCIGCFRKVFFGHRITDAEMKGLLEGKPTKVHTLTSPKNTWKSAIGFNFEEKKICLARPADEQHTGIAHGEISEEAKICSCPYCGGTIFQGKNYYLCSNKSETNCSFVCGVNVSGCKITEDDIKQLCKEKRTEKKTFTWKTGKKGMARLVIKDQKIVFDFN